MNLGYYSFSCQFRVIFMVVDRITYLALKRARQRVATPVIIKARKGFLQTLAEYVFPYHEAVAKIAEKFWQAIPAFGIFRVFPRFSMISAYLDRETIYDLAENPQVEKIYSDEIVSILQYPVVEPDGVYILETIRQKEKVFTSTLWTKRLIGADKANEKGFYGNNIRVAVIDTGAMRLHQQLSFIEFDTVLPAQRFDENGHGTWCATCIAGVRTRDAYLSSRVGRDVYCEGMAPGVNLVAIKALGYVIGTGTTSQIIAAIDKAIQDYKAEVISMSLGGEGVPEKPEDDPYYEVFNKVIETGAIPVVAAGNSGPKSNTINTPGALPQVLTVGAYNPITGEIADFSSRGPTPWGDIKPDCIAPGVNIDSGITGVLDTSYDKIPSGYSPLSGTSMATPHIAGLVAIMKEAFRNLTGYELTVQEIKRMLSQLGHQKSNNDGWGILNWDMFEHWLSTEYGVEV